jgi:putative spermidine/putrescine transport system ATP-binding protein
MKDGIFFETEAGAILRLDGHKRIVGSSTLALRPETIAITHGEPPASANSLAAKIEVMGYHGATVEYRVRTEDGICITARVTAPTLGGPSVVPIGAGVRVSWHPSAGIIVADV